MTKIESEREIEKRVICRGLMFVFSVFLLALCYNLFFLPNNLVIGGVSGLAIIFQGITGMSATVFIYGATIILIILSYFLLGKVKTKNTIIGSIMYPLMITFTEPIAKFLIPYFEFSDLYLISIIAAIIYGFGNGMVFKYNFSTGGTDIITSIVSKYLKFPEGKAMLLSNILIIIIGGFAFGLYLMLLDLIILYISSLVLDKVLFEISDSFVFYIFTHKEEEVVDLIKNEFQTGFTIMPTKGGYSHKKGEMIMAVFPNREYFHFKNRILETDPDAFFIICDCYESYGGYKKENIPYI
ncbi:MAG: YitT family protein [bacterium]